jgi:hypothetical protein
MWAFLFLCNTRTVKGNDMTSHDTKTFLVSDERNKEAAMSNFEILPITSPALRKSIVNSTPEHTKLLLMKLNPEYWGQFFKPKFTLVVDND